MEKMFKADVIGTPSILEAEGEANKLFFVHEGKKSRLSAKTHKWFKTRAEAAAFIRDYYAREVQAAKARLAQLESYNEMAKSL